jgi:hypothetical protein
MERSGTQEVLEFMLAGPEDPQAGSLEDETSTFDVPLEQAI